MHDEDSTSHETQNSNSTDLLLDSGLNLFNITANLCSKLSYEVLLKSLNYIKIELEIAVAASRFISYLISPTMEILKELKKCKNYTCWLVDGL